MDIANSRVARPSFLDHHLAECATQLPATQVQLDAVINHMIGVQVLHQHFVETDVPRQAYAKAQQYGWTV